jgi:MoxR-like ATPase
MPVMLLTTTNTRENEGMKDVTEAQKGRLTSVVLPQNLQKLAT